ncbi:hypothetical protein BJX64DRAFT_259409 [Aspergillus heterothallicus]
MEARQTPWGWWLWERLAEGQASRFRAVKRVPKQSHASRRINYSGELEAMIKFSWRKVCRQLLSPNFRPY